MPSQDPALEREHAHHPRTFQAFTYSYPVISRRSGGVSLGVNLNIDKLCNFDCPYCQVDRTVPRPPQPIDTAAIRREVGELLDTMDGLGVCQLQKFSGVPEEARKLKDIAISGDGEPTMVPEFPEVCRNLSELQASRPDLDFKLVLITNSTLLDRAAVLEGIGHLLSRRGEVWAKLDAGTEEWYQKINVSRIRLDRIEANLKRLGEAHPFAVQSMWHSLDGEYPPESELEAYLERLRRIRDAGSRITEIQLYTLARNPSNPACKPVTREFLSRLEERIKMELGFAAKVYGEPE